MPCRGRRSIIAADFGEFGLKPRADVKTIFKTVNPVNTDPASGTGAWEAGFVNTLSPRDKALIVETGQSAVLWWNMVERLGLEPEVILTVAWGRRCQCRGKAPQEGQGARHQGRMLGAHPWLCGSRRSTCARP